MGSHSRKSLMRSLGEFVGHVWKGVKTDPSHEQQRQTLRKSVEEEQRDGVTLRRTTIEEIEFRDSRNDV